MKRLIDRDLAPSSLEADAAELFRASDASDTDAIKQRVRARLVESRVRARPRFVLAPAVVVLFGLAIGTVASATIAVRWWRGARVIPTPVAMPAASHRHAAAPAAPPIAVVEPAPAATVPDGTPPATQPPQATHARRPRGPAVDAESSLLFEATRALRRERDPARAGVLLDGYFRRFPHGALAEEALALAIEAAEARGDARARTLARRYLGRYPSGHFRELAERALAGPTE